MSNTYRISTPYLTEECVVELGEYQNGRIAIQLRALDGERLATASVNMVDQECPPGHTFMKDWSENEGLVAELVRHGIVGPALKSVPAGYANASLHEVLLKEPA